MFVNDAAQRVCRGVVCHDLPSRQRPARRELDGVAGSFEAATHDVHAAMPDVRIELTPACIHRSIEAKADQRNPSGPASPWSGARPPPRTLSALSKVDLLSPNTKPSATPPAPPCRAKLGRDAVYTTVMPICALTLTRRRTWVFPTEPTNPRPSAQPSGC